jgi:mannose/fructose/N-acetylgalactosamine-specific phosphotransferase system component IIC
MILLLSILGGIVLLDKQAIGEFGVSQPIVACPLIGFIFG